MSTRKPRLVPEPYDVLIEAVERGVGYGIRRALKHTNWSITDDQIATLALNIEHEVCNEICERFKL